MRSLINGSRIFRHNKSLAHKRLWSMRFDREVEADFVPMRGSKYASKFVLRGLTGQPAQFSAFSSAR
jgi:hypothetical protein